MMMVMRENKKLWIFLGGSQMMFSSMRPSDFHEPAPWQWFPGWWCWNHQWKSYGLDDIDILKMYITLKLTAKICPWKSAVKWPKNDQRSHGFQPLMGSYLRAMERMSQAYRAGSRGREVSQNCCLHILVSTPAWNRWTCNFFFFASEQLGKMIIC